MSKKGGLGRRKHGGPHNKTHESVILLSKGRNAVSILDKSRVLEARRLEEELGAIQDGGVDVKSTAGHRHVSGQQVQVDSLLSNSDSEDMATFETTIAGTNPEWIKTKLSNIGNIFSDDLNLSEKVKEIDEMFGSESETAVAALCSDSSVFTNNTVLTLAAIEKKTHSSPCSPSHNFLEVPSGSRSRSYSDGGDHSTLNAQDRACLEEIEKGSQLSPEDKELLETRGRELQELEFDSLDNDKSNMLMTPQELEEMPDRGIEFEESVGPKVPSKSNTDVNDLITSTTGAQSVLETDTQYDDDGNPQFTTILVGTAQGEQQIVQISHAEISRLGLTVLQQNVNGQESAAGQVLADTPDSQITIQDGFLVIPVSWGSGEGNLVFQQKAAEFNDDPDDAIEGDESDSQPFFSENGIGKVWQCTVPGCGRVFTKPSKLKIHHMRHTGERPFKCESPGCDWAFTTAYQLKRHEECHTKKKEFICDVEGCGRKFTTKYNLKAHVRLHERPNTEGCPVCGKMFPTIRQLDAHLRMHENAPKTFKCPHEGCDKMFFSKHCMGSHARVHLETRDLTCKFEGCGRVFDKHCRLKQHMRSHTGEKPYVCNFEGCGWAFSTGSKLKRHERKHTGDRKYVCPVEGCHKPFLRAEHLKGHMVTHSGNKPYCCLVPECSARFTAKSSMYTHMRKHNDSEKKVSYHCPFEGCSTKYNSKTELRNHINKHYMATLLQPHLVEENLGDVDMSECSAVEVSESSNQSSSSAILLQDGCVLNPSDLLNTGTGDALKGLSITLSNNMIRELIVANENSPTISIGEFIESSSSLPISLASSVVDSDITKDLLLSEPQTSLTKTVSSSETAQTSFPEGGSARTDFHGNQILSSKARERQKMLKEKIKMDLSPLEADSNDSELAESSASEQSVEAALTSFSASELMSGTGITIRDPETGAIYVQTQLLQDDPPNGDLYDDASMETGDPDLSMTLLHDVTDVAEFAGATINLNDLE